MRQCRRGRRRLHCAGTRCPHGPHAGSRRHRHQPCPHGAQTANGTEATNANQRRLRHQTAQLPHDTIGTLACAGQGRQGRQRCHARCRPRRWGRINADRAQRRLSPQTTGGRQRSLGLLQRLRNQTARYRSRACGAPSGSADAQTHILGRNALPAQKIVTGLVGRLHALRECALQRVDDRLQIGTRQAHLHPPLDQQQTEGFGPQDIVAAQLLPFQPLHAQAQRIKVGADSLQNGEGHARGNDLVLHHIVTEQLQAGTGQRG